MNLNRFTRLAPSVEVAPTQTDENTFKFVFSNERPGRDRFIVLNSAIKHDNFDRNPVILWSHDDAQPPIGRGTNIDTSQANCTLNVSFVPRDILPFAGTVRDLVHGKWLRAVSMSWQPIEAKRSSNPDVDAIFTAIDLLEVSIVPLPALPDALLDARSRGVDTRPLGEWAQAALESRSYRAVPREQLQAIARAASQARSITLSNRAERAARAREIVDNGREDRAERARMIRERVARSDAGSEEKDLSDKNSIREAHGHMQRALKRHRELAGHLDDLGEETGKLREIHRAVTSTLDELGIEDHKAIGRALKDLDRCGRAIRKAHTGAEDAGDCAAVHVDRAADCVSTAVAAFK